jgi:metallo-beta-lactamase family protein
VSGVPYRVDFRPHPDVTVRFLDAGHILGSAVADVRVREEGKSRRVVFSGDLGQPARPIVNDPETVNGADVLLIESTYGNRRHKSLEDTLQELLAAIDETLFRRKGNLIVPSFALGRTQEFLYLLQALCAQGELPRLNVFVDSPLARRATDVTIAHHEALDPMARRFAQALHHDKLAYRLRFTQTPSESMAINKIRSGAIIVAASGMCEAGRIRHHLRHALPREECGILFTGFQAGGTLGRRIVEGAKSVRLFGEVVPVRSRVYTLGGLSAHADQEALLGWLSAIRRPPQQTFVVHGEESTAETFADLLRDGRGWPVIVPARGETHAC